MCAWVVYVCVCVWAVYVCVGVLSGCTRVLVLLEEDMCIYLYIYIYKVEQDTAKRLIINPPDYSGPVLSEAALSSAGADGSLPGRPAQILRALTVGATGKENS